MSWLSDRLARGAVGPFRVEDLAAAIGRPPATPNLTSALAVRLGLDRGWVRRCRRLGLSDLQADRWATRAGLHPLEIWPHWYDAIDNQTGDTP